MGKSAPARIEPFYEFPDDLENSVLFESESAELQQGDKTFKGKLRIIQKWVPLVSYAEFSTDSPSEIGFDDARVKASSLNASIRVVTKMSNGIEGYLNGSVEIGSDHKLDKVTFHLPNYPNLYGGHDYHDTITKGETTTSIRSSEVVLENDGWNYPCTRTGIPSHFDKTPIHAELSCLVVSGRFVDQMGSNSNIRTSSLSLKHFEYSCPSLLQNGCRLYSLSARIMVAPRSWQMWTNYDVTTQWHSRGWLDELHGQHLAEAFPGFCKLWEKKEWRVSFTQSVTWLIEASRRSAVQMEQLPSVRFHWRCLLGLSLSMTARFLIRTNSRN